VSEAGPFDQRVEQAAWAAGPSPDMTTRISAVICTRNRADRLALAVQSLTRDQTLPRELYEVIVVDNGSTDRTATLMAEIGRDCVNLRVITEPTLGLTPARNRGWRAARSPYVAFMDDDAIAEPGWLEHTLAAFEQSHPRPAAVGGKIFPIWEYQRPDWLSDPLLELFSVCDYSSTPVYLPDVLHRQSLVGANIAFTKAALERVGGFTEGLGRVGANLLSGEELLVQIQLEDLGEPIYYEPRAVVGHLVPKNRVTREWILARSYWGGISDALLVFFRRGPSFRTRVRLLAYGLRSLSPRDVYHLIARSPDLGRLDLEVRARSRLGFLVGAVHSLGRPARQSAPVPSNQLSR
jgi:glucosyl-dolichyl phosphate glucuronosyltransferase